MSKLSIIVPVFNEAGTIQEVLERLLALALDKEIIVVDDGSTDGTEEKINYFSSRIKIVKHGANQGKGAAMRTGVSAAQGDYIVFCDADLEYDANQISLLFDHILRHNAAVVYGSRFIDYQPQKNRIHYLGNWFLTWLTNRLFGAKLTDLWTCYKLFPREASGFFPAGKFESELSFSARLIRNGFEIIEVEISHNPRSFSEGKKIGYMDGIKGILTVFKEYFRN